MIHGIVNISFFRTSGIRFPASDTTVVPRRIQRLISGMRVFAEQSVTVAKKHFGGLESLLMPPKTQQSSTRLPWLYFLLPNLLSSILTILSGPPIGSESRSGTTQQTS